MANMLRNKRRLCQCCGDPEFTRGQARRQEQREWRGDQMSALTPSFHEEQYEMSDWDWDGAGSNDASDLEGIPRVYCDMGQELLAWR
jgi:hypothetical protein